MKLPRLQVRAAALVYAAAGVTLVCNDWWWKGSGLLPGWLTGKLSDVAGLLVAIVTAALLLGRAARAAQLASGAIVLVFGLVKIDPWCTDLLVAGLAGIGVTWSVRTDPTDLLALGVVPLAWTTARTLAQRMQRVGIARFALRASAIPAALACLASGVPDQFSARGYVYNDSGETLFVEISSIPWLECSRLETWGTDWLERSDFQSLGLYRIGPREVVPLDGLHTSSCACGLYRIAFEGKNMVVRVPENSVALARRPDREEVHDARPQLVFLRPGAELLPGSRLEVLEIPVTAAETSCTEEPGAMTFGARVAGLESAQIVAIEPVAGDCIELELATDVPPLATGAGGAAGASGDTPAPGGAAGAAGMTTRPSNPGSERVQLCAPRELLPFDIGDIVSLSVHADAPSWPPEADPIRHQLEVIDRTGARGFRMEVGAPRAGFVTLTEPEASCGPNRDDERQPWLPLEASVAPGGRGFALFGLSPGTLREVELADGTRAKVYLGRAHRHFTTCNPVPDWVEVVESWSR